MTGFVLAEGTHQMPERSGISIGRYQDGILRVCIYVCMYLYICMNVCVWIAR